MDVPSDPDRYALAIVQQWLQDQGHTKALAALEQEAGLRVRQELHHGSQLLQLVYGHMEAQAAASLDEAEVQRRRIEERLLSGGTASGPSDCPCRLRASIEGLHPANITAVKCRPAARQAVSGSSDGSVRVVGYDGTLLSTLSAGTTGVLCLALLENGAAGGSGGEPCSGSGDCLVAAGCMDGSVAVLDLGSGALLAKACPHRKYVVAARWASGGRHLITASWDCSFAVHRLQRRQPPSAEAGPTGSGSGAATSGDSGADGGWELVTVHSEQTPAKVNAVEVLPPLAGTGGGAGEEAEATFLVAVQGSNYLRQLAICREPSAGEPGSSGSGGAPAVREVRRINLNGPSGDDHVSFSAAHLALSPCGGLLLVSADNGRLVVYERTGWTQVRSIIGLPTEQFHHYCAAWHSSGQYIMAGAAHGGLCIFHVGSANRVATVAAHTKNLRGLAYDAPNNLLLTCSFDRTLKLWEAQGQGGAQRGGEQQSEEA